MNGAFGISFPQGQFLVFNWNSLHQISECIWITLWHIACNNLFESIDASISILFFMIWVRGEVNRKGASLLCI